MRSARQYGVACVMLTAGMHKFIRGANAIAFIEQLATLGGE